MKHAIFNRLALAPVALLLAGGMALSAQEAQPSFGAAVSLVNPMGTMADVVGPGFSVGAFYEMPFGSSYALRGTLEYAMFTAKEIGDIKSSMSHIGAIADALWYFGEARKGYGLAGLGYYSQTVTVEVGGSSRSTSDSGIGYNIGGGYWFSKNLGAEVKYISATDAWLQVSLRYRF
jgi:hypothetical protein